MYLISLYFDEKSNQRISHYISRTAMASGNQFMTEKNVPPHITISSFEAFQIEPVLEKLSKVLSEVSAGTIQWVSVGQFLPDVLFIAPVLNEFLHTLSETIYQTLDGLEGVRVSPYYRPFAWLPHTTIGKRMTKEEMQKGFAVLQNSFGVFEGMVVKIGIAKPNPYTDLVSWDLKNDEKTAGGR